ncbi:MAG: DUF4388 domain-containing protein, partial [Candidatus Dormibacteraeota bacterium]|nr:DUF4388 domain-containing protein [Candidatus Dormibacteraeota bacterium]
MLESAQAERATGTLTLRHNGEQPTTLYFLFGHLFHAIGDGGAGDDVVVKALSWNSGEFDFDAKAKLPADESVKAQISDLLSRGPAMAGPQPPNGPSNWPPQRGMQQQAPPPQSAPPRRQAPMEARNADPGNSRSYGPGPEYPAAVQPAPTARRGQGRGAQMPSSPAPQPR